MERSSLFLVLMGTVVAAGLGMSVWGNQVLFEGFTSDGRTLDPADILVVTAQLNESSGVYAVEVAGTMPDAIYVTVTGPDGSGIVVEEKVNADAHEGHFVTTPGKHSLSVANRGDQELPVTAYIGPEPDASKRTIAFVSMYMLVIGMVGMPIGIIWTVAKRRR